MKRPYYLYTTFYAFQLYDWLYPWWGGGQGVGAGVEPQCEKLGMHVVSLFFTDLGLTLNVRENLAPLFFAVQVSLRV